MTEISEPPIYQPIADQQTGIAALPWILFFNALFTGDTGTDWTPTFTSLTQTGVPTITGRVYRIGRSWAIFRVTIVPATDTSSTAGVTYIDNFPLTMSNDGFNLAVTGLVGSSAGMCDSATNRIYMPTWTSIVLPLTIIGLVEAN